MASSQMAARMRFRVRRYVIRAIRPDRPFHGAATALLVLLLGPLGAFTAHGAADLESLTAGLRSTHREYLSAKDDAERRAAAAELKRASAERNAALRALMRKDPQAALAIAMASTERSALPAFVQPLIEERKTVHGIVETWWLDYRDRARRADWLVNSNGRWKLHFAGRRPALQAGSALTASGLVVGDYMALDSSGDASVTVAANQDSSGPLDHAFGAQRTLVVLVKFDTSPAEPWTSQQIGDVVFSQVDDYYRDLSNNRTWFEGDVTAWYSLPLDPAVCDVESVASSANAKAQAAGYDVATYDRVLYVAPGLLCGWAGLAVTGPIVPSRAWLTSIKFSVVAHELGHNLGLHHSRGSVCRSGDPWNGDCDTYAYADMFDIMGNASGSPFNALQMRRLGYLDTDTVHTSIEVLASGDYTIGAYAASDGQPKALRIAAGVDPVTGVSRTLHVTLRQPVGRDAGLAYILDADQFRIRNGIVINLSEGADGSLLDMTPLSRTGISDLTDAPLLVGEAYVEPASGITISPVEVRDGLATVAISLPPDTEPAPVNEPPVALDDSAATSGGGTVEVAVLGNDYDPDGDAIRITRVSAPAFGTVSMGANGLPVYKAARKFRGTDTFTYEVSDGASSAAASVTVRVDAASKPGRR